MIYFDIETGSLSLRKLRRMMPDFEAPRNIKDPVKIKAAIREKQSAFIEKAALSPTTGEILAIGFADDESPDSPTLLFSDEAGGERKLIEYFFSLSKRGSPMCGFNNHGFDIPFIVRRAWSHGVPVPKDFTGRYPSDRFIDLLKLWKLGNQEQGISLGNLAKYFGVGEKSGAAEDFASYYKNDRAKAKEYLLGDIELTRLCARKMGIV